MIQMVKGLAQTMTDLPGVLSWHISIHGFAAAGSLAFPSCNLTGESIRITDDRQQFVFQDGLLAFYYVTIG